MSEETGSTLTGKKALIFFPAVCNLIVFLSVNLTPVKAALHCPCQRTGERF